MQFRLVAAAVAVLSLALVLSLVSLDTREVTAAPTKYAIDAGHSTVLFSINHLGVSNTWGRFNGIEGSFSLNDENPTDCAVECTVDASSIDTNSADRDGHLKGPDFFNVKEFPTIKFKSTKVAKGAEAREFVVTGDLTLHGVTKSVTIHMTKIGEADLSKAMPHLGYRAGFEGMLTIKRSDFGMDNMVPHIGDEVRLILAVEGMRQ